jgi:hypothetical protein
VTITAYAIWGASQIAPEDRVFKVARVEALLGDAVIPRLSITGESLEGEEDLGADIVDTTLYRPKGSAHARTSYFPVSINL